VRRARFDAVRVADVKINCTTKPHGVEVRGALVNLKTGMTYAWTVPMRALTPETQKYFDAFVAALEADLDRAHFEASDSVEPAGMRPPEEPGDDFDDEGTEGIGEHFGGDLG
jgi:hypothetical protein